MKNAVIFYFSSTGNTWWCALRIREQLERARYTAEAYSIEQVSARQVSELCSSAELIGIGYPIYGSDLPEPMKRFLDDILPVYRESSGRLFVFVTQLFFSGDGAYIYGRELRRKGWRIFSGVHLLMPNSISVKVFPLHSTNDRTVLDRKLEHAGRRISVFCQRLLSEAPLRQGHLLTSHLLGLLQRPLYRTFFHRLQDDISIDHERCTGCLRCVRICPVDNLIVEEGMIIPQGHCVICLRCYNYCPVQAVKYMDRSHAPGQESPYIGPVGDFKPELICRKRPGSTK